MVTALRLLDVFCAKDVPFGVIIFNFHIFACFSPKIVKIKPEIGNFQPKC